MESAGPDYVEGHLVDRTVPDYDHSRIQIRLGDSFKTLEDSRKLYRSSKIRLRIANDRFRIADVDAFSSETNEPIPRNPPMVVVEIVLPDHRQEDLMNKLADYERAGIAYIFVVRTAARRFARFIDGDLRTVPALELPELQLKIMPSSIFM